MLGMWHLLSVKPHHCANNFTQTGAQALLGMTGGRSVALGIEPEAFPLSYILWPFRKLFFTF